MSDHPTAEFYDSLTTDKPHREHPDDPRPVGEDAIHARTRAMRDGRLIAVPRDELNRKPAPLTDLQVAQQENAALRSEVEDLRSKVAQLVAGAMATTPLDPSTPA